MSQDLVVYLSVAREPLFVAELAWGARGREFESRHPDQKQAVETST